MAISIVQQWIAVGSGTTAIDATGADCLVVGNIALNSGFTAGLAVPTVLSYAGVSMLSSDGGTPGTGYAYRYLNSSGAANALGIWVLCAPATGSNNLIITQQAGPFGAGPRPFYCLLSGVDQTNPVRTGSVIADDTTGTSISFAFTGLTAGDLLNAIGGDFGDTAHTATGTGATLVLDSAAVNSESAQVTQLVATGASHTIGVGSGSVIFGVGIPFIAATAGGATAIGNPGLIMAI